MASTSTKTPKKIKTESVSVATVPVNFGRATVSKHSNSVLISPRITEKAAVGADSVGVYAFNVGMSANKKEIAAAVKELFKVTPVSIRVVAVPSKAVASRRSRVIGHTARAKKAYVTLKKGDTIEFV